jgi:hypothetical protein
MLSLSGPFPRSIILSQLPTVPVNRTTDTIVRPPFVAIFKVRDPASRYCDFVRSKVTWPLPSGPPSALYTGRMADPTGAMSRVNTDANEGLDVMRAKNLLVEEVLEKKDRRFVLM